MQECPEQLNERNFVYHRQLLFKHFHTSIDSKWFTFKAFNVASLSVHIYMFAPLSWSFLANIYGEHFRLKDWWGLLQRYWKLVICTNDPDSQPLFYRGSIYIPYQGFSNFFPPKPYSSRLDISTSNGC